MVGRKFIIGKGAARRTTTCLLENPTRCAASAGEMADPSHPTLCGGDPNGAQCVREMVKNPWGADGWVCVQCQMHLRGQAHTCRQCETAICKKCWALFASSAARPQSIPRSGDIPVEYSTSINTMNSARSNVEYSDSTRSEIAQLDFGALAFGGEARYGSQSARPYVSARRDDSYQSNMQSIMTARPYQPAAADVQSTTAVPPPATFSNREAPHYSSVSMATPLAERQPAFALESPTPQIRQKEGQRRSDAATRNNRSLEASLACFVDTIEGKETGVDQSTAQAAWRRVTAARRDAPKGPRDAVLDAMIMVTEYRLASERAARRKMERELKMAREQLSKALSLL